MIKQLLCGHFCPIKYLTGFHFFDRSAALFEENAVSAVWTPDVDVNLNFLLAPCTFICTCHILSKFIL